MAWAWQIERLHAFWQSRHVGDRLPARTDIDPVELWPILPNLFMLDVLHRPFDLRYRLIGTVIVRKEGRDKTGALASEAYTGNDWTFVERRYRRVVEDRVPDHHADSIRGRDGRYYDFERLFLPLASDGRTVDAIIGCVVFHTLAPDDDVLPRVFPSTTPLS